MYCGPRLVCAVALALCALFSSLASAQTPGYKEYNAFAYFYEQTEGCDLFETYLDVFERWTPLESGLTEHSTTLKIDSLHYDTCEETYVSVVRGSMLIPDNAFRTQGLKTASVQTALSFTDSWTGEIVPVILDLRWTCDRARIDRAKPASTCAPLTLSGSVLVGSRDLMDLSSRQGELILWKY
ncbi:MAG TPA: hypothetical protein VNM67_19520 [Thermoanaerobaculia bacterium]|jgi:hypothetical protein|nr:hypothetical protein [Thermoanaerobaculia bacterium]